MEKIENLKNKENHYFIKKILLHQKSKNPKDIKKIEPLKIENQKPDYYGAFKEAGLLADLTEQEIKEYRDWYKSEDMIKYEKHEPDGK